MKSKAFTLVELLAVIVIIGFVSVIVIPNVMSSISNAHLKAYNTQVNEIIAMAKKWAASNTDKLDKYHLNNTYITFSTLKKEGYMKNGKIKNPKDNEQMVGCIEIVYNSNNNSYDYNYLESDNKIEENACDTKKGYIYTYKDNNLVVNKDNAIKVAYDIIYDKNNNDIKVIGQTEAGLYDIEDDYIFKGSEINNYVKLGNHNDIWRIISMNKKDKTIKLIKNTSIGENEWDSNGNIKYENSTVKIDKLDSEFNKDTSSISKIAAKINNNNEFKVGLIDIIDNYDNIRIKEDSEIIKHKIGLMNISDYLGASTTCESFDVDSCRNNNYIYDMFKSSSAWTINNNGSQIWYINNEGNIDLSDPNNTYKNYYPVITLNSNITVTDGIGTNTAPYVIE